MSSGQRSLCRSQTQPGSIIVKGPLELLCVDFTTMDPSMNSKENVLVLTDAFPNSVRHL